MTVEDTTSKQIAQQMGNSFEYPFTFTVLLSDPTEEDAKKAIKAKVRSADGIITDLVYNSEGVDGYSIVLNDNRNGGVLTVTNKRTTDDYITIYREYEETQEADYQDFNAAPADTYEQCFDKLTMLCQQQQEQIDRSIKVEMASNVSPEALVEQVVRIYESIDNIDTVADDKANLDTVAGNVEDINTCAENIDYIVTAPQHAQNAAISAQNAATSENNAEIWAEGTDEQVQILGGIHSAKGWANASQGANIDLSNITEAGKEVIKENSGAGLEIGDVAFTQGAIDETKGLRRKLNGSVIVNNTNTQGFFNWLEAAVAANPSIATTEAEWQSENTANGMCGKFVLTYEPTYETVQYNVQPAHQSVQNEGSSSGSGSSDEVNCYIIYPTGTTIDVGSTVYITTELTDNMVLSDIPSYSVSSMSRDMSLTVIGFSISGGEEPQKNYIYLDTIQQKGFLVEQDTQALTEARLPNYPGYFLGNSPAGTLPVVGNGKALGLSNGTDLAGLGYTSGTSDFQPKAAGYGANVTNTNAPNNHTSGGYYGLPTAEELGNNLQNSGCVTTEIPDPYKINGTYFIQIATGQETQVNITNEIELNNPFFLGMSQYFEAEPNNLSWLKSAGQWNSKAVYPDYYNWLLQEKNNPSTLPASANVEITGSLINNNGVLSGFGESNYAEIPQAPSDIESLELVFKFTTGDDITTRQSVYGQTITNIACPQCIISGSEANMSLLEVLLGLDAGTWGEPIFSLSVAGANTTYTTKVTWDNASKNMVFSLKTEDGDFIQQGTVTQNTVYWTEPMRIGADKKSYPWLGSIDLNGCYININGSRWWSGMTNGVKFSTEDYTDYDYVINTSDETFRLPLLDGSEDLPSDNLIHASGNLTISSPEPVSVYTAPKNCYVTLRTFGMTLVNSAVVGFISGNVVYTQLFGSTNNQNSDVIFMQRNQTLTLKINSANSTTPTVSYNLNVRAAQGNGSLYYYTGETVQNASLVNAGRIAETKANKTEIDGVWAGSYSVIFTGVSFTAGQSRTYSLSEYLPNDGNIYEVLFIGRVTTGAAAGDTARLNLTTSVIPTSYPFVAAQTPAARAMYVIGSVLMPVGVDRNIKVTNTSAGDTATFELAVTAYRKVR